MTVEIKAFELVLHMYIPKQQELCKNNRSNVWEEWEIILRNSQKNNRQI